MVAAGTEAVVRLLRFTAHSLKISNAALRRYSAADTKQPSRVTPDYVSWLKFKAGYRTRGNAPPK